MVHRCRTWGRAVRGLTYDRTARTWQSYNPVLSGLDSQFCAFPTQQFSHYIPWRNIPMYTGKYIQKYQVVIVKTSGSNPKCLSVGERIDTLEHLNTEIIYGS